GEKEGARVMPPVGGPGTAAPAAPVIGAIEPEVIPLSSFEVDYPLLRDAYANSALDSESEVLAWREAAREPSRPPPAGALVALPAPRPSAARTLAEAIMPRRPTRELPGAALRADLLSPALWYATRTW